MQFFANNLFEYVEEGRGGEGGILQIVDLVMGCSDSELRTTVLRFQCGPRQLGVSETFRDRSNKGLGIIGNMKIIQQLNI